MSLIILRHQTVTLKDKLRAENHWTIMNWSDLHLWEPEKVLWDLRPLDSLFSRIGQLVRLLSSRWPPSTNDSLFGRHLHSSDLLGRRWIMMGLPWRRPTTHHVASVSILRRWLSRYLVACQPRWSNSEEQIIFADLDQRGIQSRNSPLEYLCRSRKLCQRLCSNWVQKLAVYAEDEISCC